LARISVKLPQKIKSANVLIDDTGQHGERSGSRLRVGEEYEIFQSEGNYTTEEMLNSRLQETETQDMLEVQEEIQNAYNQGFTDGQETTKASFQTQIQQHMKWLKNLDSVIQELRIQYSQSIVNFEESIVSLAVMIAGHIIEREISTDSEIVINQVKKAIRSLDNDVIFKIRIHPENVEILYNVKSELITDKSLLEKVVISPDHSVDPAGCILETSSGMVDARLKTQLEQIEHTLNQVRFTHEISAIEKPEAEQDEL
jgi:flagellar biosynthesis/type III secretory pathway protein FliH